MNHWTRHLFSRKDLTIGAWCMAVTVLLFAVGSGVVGCPPCPITDRARLDIANLTATTRIFFARKGRLPLGAGELVAAQMLEKHPLDPWGHPYRYWIVLGQPAFVSLGADGACGGEGEASDIGPPEPRPGECGWRSR